MYNNHKMVTVNVDLPEEFYNNLLHSHYFAINTAPEEEDCPTFEIFLGYLVVRGMEKIAEDMILKRLKNVINFDEND
jgi:hypothetical protein